jgi:hypothetical protein
VLRALVQASTLGCRPEVLLDINDRRTLRSVLARAGMHPAQHGVPSMEDFLRSQRFVPVTNEGLKLLRQWLLARSRLIS